MLSDELLQLRSIGLTEGEIKVYDALLKLGEATKTLLAKTAGIAPANLYDITNRLAEKGIISIVEKNNVKHFSPANPKQLLSFLEQKKQEITKEEHLITALLPKLQAAYGDKQRGIRVEVFTGWNGLKTVFTDMIDECVAKDRCSISGASEGVQSKQADRFFLKYSRLRAQKGILLNIIFNESVRKRKERVAFFLKSKQCNVRFLNQNTLAEIMLYKDTAVIVTLTAEPIAIRIRSKEVTQNFLEQFNAVWSIAKP